MRKKYVTRVDFRLVLNGPFPTKNEIQMHKSLLYHGDISKVGGLPAGFKPLTRANHSSGHIGCKDIVLKLRF